MTHLLWDWNGTLLDDTVACLDALNLMLTRRGLAPISLAFYRRTFAFPVRDFYSRIGLRLEDEDWDALAREYHETYNAQPFSLNAQALAALEAARQAGFRQSIISALRQDMLDEATRRFGVRDFFIRICGSDNLNGSSKLDRAKSLLDELRIIDGADADYVMIGDSLHDHDVARALGIRSILFSGGGHAADRLAAVAPTVPTLLEAVARSVP